MIEVYTKKENCSGCSACKSVCPVNAITMISDDEGFLYPSIDTQKCVKCKLCLKVCPFYENFRLPTNYSLPEVYAVKHKSDKVRITSTSGGMFTAISDKILEQDGLVYGAAFDKEFNLIHSKAESEIERNLFKGSKYIQSDLLNSFKEIKVYLLEGKIVLFTGTPCQNAGLYSYLINSGVDIDKLYLCDIVCHGTPSPLIWREYINFIFKKYKKTIKEYYFRYKPKGWRGMNVYIKFNDGSSLYNNSDALLYTKIFYSHFATRPSCHSCKFTNLNRPSDITIADFWGIERTMPEFDDNKGISLVLINSEKGKKLFEEVKSNIVFIKSDTKECLQPNLYRPSYQSPIRIKFWKDYQNKGFIYVLKKYADYGFNAKIRNCIRKVIRLLLEKVGLLSIVKKYLTTE